MAVVSNNNNQFFSIDILSGTINWKQDFSSELRPTIISNYLITISDNGLLVIMNKDSGQIIRINDLFKNIKEKRKKDFQPVGFLVGKFYIYVSTNNGRIYHSIDRGNNWTVYQSPISDFGSAEVNGNLSFADPQNGVIIDNSGNVYRSTNAGASWTQISTTGPVYTSGLCFIEGTNTIFSTGGGSSFSNDGGYSWNPIDTTTHLYVDFHDENIGWSGGWTQETGFITVGGVWKWEDFSLDIDEIIDLNELIKVLVAVHFYP